MMRADDFLRKMTMARRSDAFLALGEDYVVVDPLRLPPSSAAIAAETVGKEVPPVPDYRDRRVGVCPTAVVDPAVVRRPCRRRPSPPPPLLRGHRRGDSGQGRGLRRCVLPRCVGRPPRRLSPSSESLLTLDFDMGIPIASFLPFVKNLRWLCMCDPPWLKAPSMGLGMVPAICVFDEDDLPSRPLSFPVGTGEV